MIDQNFLESAKIIRREFLSLNNSLDTYQEDVKKLSDFFFKIVKDLEDYSNDEVSKIKSNKDVEEVKTFLLNKLTEIETESNKLTQKIDPINRKIEKLREDEQILYKTIKLKYPDISDDDLKKEIHSKLD